MARLTKLNPPQVADRIRSLEQQLSLATIKIQEAEGRADRAEKACQEAWRFAKAICGRPLRRP